MKKNVYLFFIVYTLLFSYQHIHAGTGNPTTEIARTFSRCITGAIVGLLGAWIGNDFSNTHYGVTAIIIVSSLALSGASVLLIEKMGFLDLDYPFDLIVSAGIGAMSSPSAYFLHKYLTPCSQIQPSTEQDNVNPI